MVYNYDQYNWKKTLNISFLLAVLIMAFHLQGISLVNIRAACFTFWDKWTRCHNTCIFTKYMAYEYKQKMDNLLQNPRVIYIVTI